jgi:hypothetical protein
VLAGESWNLPGELGMYCAGHPRAYSLGPLRGERHSQYELWPGPLDRPEEFRGRTFVVVGTLTPEMASGFQRVEPPRPVVYAEHGQPVAGWWLTVCRGFRGFPAAGKARKY